MHKLSLLPQAVETVEYETALTTHVEATWPQKHAHAHVTANKLVTHRYVQDVRSVPVR